MRRKRGGQREWAKRSLVATVGELGQSEEPPRPREVARLADDRQLGALLERHLGLIQRSGRLFLA